MYKVIVGLILKPILIKLYMLIYLQMPCAEIVFRTVFKF